MNDTISRQAAIDAVQKAKDKSEAHRMLIQLPTVDVVPVRRGRWIKKRYWSEGVGMGESYGYWYACSECNHEVKSGYGGCSDRFCNNCGADMREDGEHD